MKKSKRPPNLHKHEDRIIDAAWTLIQSCDHDASNSEVHMERFVLVACRALREAAKVDREAFWDDFIAARAEIERLKAELAKAKEAT